MARRAIRGEWVLMRGMVEDLSPCGNSSHGYLLDPLALNGRIFPASLIPTHSTSVRSVFTRTMTWT